MSTGNQLAGGDRQKTVTFKADADAVERFDAVLDDLGYSNRSEALREFVENNAPETGDRHFLPQRDDLRKQYEAMLAVANESLIVHPRIRGSELAQRLSAPRDELHAVLIDLRRKGYVAQQNAQPGTARDGRGTVYRVKPRCADPDIWKYRETF
ncbi:hypothetical protein [Haloparvum sedimenti]|uniref:hypothetical protein n=1 Tax=Haloparvum sedimenti TaxID=1678448 RepID=UPI00071E9BF5|nr:hypothetical protein [Haloparvum sedimenti]